MITKYLGGGWGYILMVTIFLSAFVSFLVELKENDDVMKEMTLTYHDYVVSEVSHGDRKTSSGKKVYSALSQSGDLLKSLSPMYVSQLVSKECWRDVKGKRWCDTYVK